MKRIQLPPPESATREEKAAWAIYPDYASGPKSSQYIYPQPHNRERIMKLASGGYGTLLSCRQRNEVKQFNEILATIA